MAAACALFAPLLVLVSLNARGDTDAHSVDPPKISQFTLQLDSDDLGELQHHLPGAVVSWAYEGAEDLEVSGSCSDAARRLALNGCRELRALLGAGGPTVFRGDADPPAEHSVSIWAWRDDDPIESFATAAAVVPFYALTEHTTPYIQSSPIVPWLLSGIGIAVLAAMLAILVLVIDRSMTARAIDSLDRLGLSLGIRRMVDATTFFFSCLLAGAAGLVLGVVSAIVLSRDEFSGLFPWQELLALIAGVGMLALLGAGAVAVGSNKAHVVTDRSGAPGRAVD